MRGSTTGRTVALATCALALVAGCAGPPAQPVPTIGSPSASTAPSATPTQRPDALAAQWDLSGTALPADWPDDVPLPRGTEVVSAYAIGTDPRRTWSATFTTPRGTALDMAEPVVAALRDLDYVPIAEYVGAPETNTGLFSFAAPAFAVYVVLGEDDGQPNVVITVRGSTEPTEVSTASPTSGPSASGGSPPVGKQAEPLASGAARD